MAMFKAGDAAEDAPHFGYGGGLEGGADTVKSSRMKASGCHVKERG